MRRDSESDVLSLGSCWVPCLVNLGGLKVDAVVPLR
jgi:hypothetical protein